MFEIFKFPAQFIELLQLCGARVLSQVEDFIQCSPEEKRIITVDPDSYTDVLPNYAGNSLSTCVVGAILHERTILIVNDLCFVYRGRNWVAFIIWLAYPFSFLGWRYSANGNPGLRRQPN